jgi:hypothetical protein
LEKPLPPRRTSNKVPAYKNAGSHATSTDNVQLDNYQRAIALLHGQLKHKEEIITLLRASYTCPQLAMISRLLTLSFTTTLLLGGLASCAKKDTPAPVTNVASYTLDGKARTCTTTQASSSRAGLDYLTITLTTTPLPSNGLPETLSLNLVKLTGTSNATYGFLPVGAILYNGFGNSLTLGFQTNSTSRTSAPNGGISGTFAGEARSYSAGGTYTVAGTLTKGTFTNVQP